MTDIHRGQRIVLVHVTNPHTALRPGDTGTVRDTGHDDGGPAVQIDWDNGSVEQPNLDAGDRIIPTDTIPGSCRPDVPAHFNHILIVMAIHGAHVGRIAADWWAQHTVGGYATGDTAATARRILAGLDDGDPAVLDTLPAFGPDQRAAMPSADDVNAAAPAWVQAAPTLAAEQWQTVVDSYIDAFDAAVWGRVAESCHAAADATRPAQAFVGLRHTLDMQLPHDRFAVTRLRLRLQVGTTGTTFTGVLSFDGAPIATVTGGPEDTRLTTLTERFDADTFAGFVAACRHHGAPVTERRLLDALVDERHLDQLVAQASADGGTYARFVTDTGHTVAVCRIAAMPDRETLPELRRQLAAETGTTGENLQIWTGTAWAALPDTGTNEVAEATA